MLFYFSLLVLVLVFGASRFSAGRPFSASQILIKRIFLFAILIIFSLLAYYSYQQYQVWNSNELTKHFLIQGVNIIGGININYFIYYVGARFFAPYIISLVAAFAFLHIAKNLNKKFNERFFYEEEIWFGALALFLIGWPGALFYFIGLILIYLLVHVSCFMFHVSGRISLYYLWIPIAIIAIIINNLLVGLEWWKLLKI